MKDHTALLDDFVSLIEQVISIQVDPASINRETGISSDLMIDSISLVSLMTLSEEFFEVNLQESADSVANIQTVGDALDLIASLMPGGVQRVIIE
jgi:acyl carrier protein